MSYLNVVRTITNILFTVLGLTVTHFFIYAIVGVFCKKTYPHTEKKHKYGLIIPARNEESVISGLIESIQKNDYPQDNLQIFVIAHNCTDKTAEIARSLGAITYEYNNPRENTMGYAFKYLFSQIEQDYGTQNYDGFFLFNADNVLDKNYISLMNDAFEFYNGESVITSYRNSKNFGSNIISGLYGLYFATGCRLESCGRTVTGCSTRVQGTGYLINSRIVKDGWKYTSLAEDWEFTADQVISENTIKYCDDAIFYDEQPTSVRIMWRQRMRWSKGHLIVFKTRIKDLIKKLFAKNTKHRVSIYDITANTLPFPLLLLLLEIIRFILFIIAPLIDDSITMKQIFIGSFSANQITYDGLLFIWLKSAIYSYITIFLGALVVFFVDRKRTKSVSLWEKIKISLVWPIFLLIQIPIDVQVLFSKNLSWKPIPHNDQTSFEQVNH